MLRNLRAEMARYGVKVGDISEVLGVRLATVSDKLNGHYPFTFDEAIKIKKVFFPTLDLEYLFQRSKSESA